MPLTPGPALSANATRWLERALALAALAAIAVVAATMALRAAFPFELEWYEGWSREHVWRLREGLATQYQTLPTRTR